MTYMNVWTSIAAYINQQRSMIVANGITPAESIEMIDWEAHANIEELPAVHLVGPASLALEQQSQEMYHASFVVGLGSYNDQGLFIHREMIDFLFKSLSTGTRISVFDSKTEEAYSWMKIIDGVTVAPLSRTSQRAMQFIQIEALVDPLA
ncbi:hypothetical protein [Mesorhizobium sp. WSM2239]|uniref:Uncharacterized protein n=2 Tax=unclassified Mesorhizobium TaxID=325217 RepID=A0AAU8DF15_9HYPH